MDPPPATLAALFLERAHEHGDRAFVVEEGGAWSYARVAADAARAARWLSARVAPGAAVGIVLPNGGAYAASFFGILLAGCVAVPLDPRLHPRELRFLLEHAGCEVVIAGAPPGAADLPAGCAPAPCREIFSEPPARSDHAPRSRPGDAAVVLATSGSTARPKAVVLTHGNLLANERAWSARYRFHSDDVFLGTLSHCHSFGKTACLLAALDAGARLVIAADPQPGALSALAARHGATVFAAVASFYQYLVRSPAVRAEDFRGVRMWLSGACALPAEVARRFHEVFGREILQTYGLTEASPVVTANPPGDCRRGTVGTALEGVSLDVAEDDELRVRGPGVMRGYLRDAEATAACLDGDGWLRTGDLARIDEGGYVTILGRKKDLIVRAGAKLYPDEIEEVIRSCPAVADAAVVGMPDPAYEEVPVAFVVASGGAIEPEALRAFCLDRMAAFKVPRIFRVVDALPRSPNGKVLKAALRASLSDPRAPGAGPRRGA